MGDSPNRMDSWVQWAVILLAILGAVWNIGGQLGEIRQELKDTATLQDVQAHQIGNLEQEVLDLTRHVK